MSWMGLGGYYNPTASDPAEEYVDKDSEFLNNFAKEVAELMLKTSVALEELTRTEPDECYRERLERDIRANAWLQIDKIVERLII